MLLFVFSAHVKKKKFKKKREKKEIEKVESKMESLG
jgi:TATA-binding protein-associated factor Taf7